MPRHRTAPRRWMYSLQHFSTYRCTFSPSLQPACWPLTFTTCAPRRGGAPAPRCYSRFSTFFSQYHAVQQEPQPIARSTTRKATASLVSNPSISRQAHGLKARRAPDALRALTLRRHSMAPGTIRRSPQVYKQPQRLHFASMAPRCTFTTHLRTRCHLRTPSPT